MELASSLASTMPEEAHQAWRHACCPGPSWPLNNLCILYRDAALPEASSSRDSRSRRHPFYCSVHPAPTVRSYTLAWCLSCILLLAVFVRIGVRVFLNSESDNSVPARSSIRSFKATTSLLHFHVIIIFHFR